VKKAKPPEEKPQIEEPTEEEIETQHEVEAGHRDRILQEILELAGELVAMKPRMFNSRHADRMTDIIVARNFLKAALSGRQPKRSTMELER
jgi:hypothetical protein